MFFLVTLEGKGSPDNLIFGFPLRVRVTPKQFTFFWWQSSYCGLLFGPDGSQIDLHFYCGSGTKTDEPKHFAFSGGTGMKAFTRKNYLCNYCGLRFGPDGSHINLHFSGGTGMQTDARKLPNIDAQSSVLW